MIEKKIMFDKNFKNANDYLIQSEREYEYIESSLNKDLDEKKDNLNKFNVNIVFKIVCLYITNDIHKVHNIKN